MPAARLRQSLGVGEPEQPPHRREAAELTQPHEPSAARLQIRVNELLDTVVLPRMTHTRFRGAQPVSVVGGRVVLVLAAAVVVVVVVVVLVVVLVVAAAAVVVVVAPALEDSAPGNHFRKTLPGALSSNEGLDSPVSMPNANLDLNGPRWR